MNRNILFVVLIIQASFLIGCNRKFSTQTENIYKILANYNKLTDINKKVYFFIGIKGCGPCIEKAIRFAKNNLNRDEFVYIITHQGRKEINFKFSKVELENPNFLIDHLGMSFKLQMLHTNPVAYICKNGEVIKIHNIVNEGDAEKILDLIQ